MRRILVVANQTLASPALREAVRQRIASEPCRFHVVVPATPPREQLFWTEGGANSVACRRLEEALAWMHGQGALTTGTVGDANPVLAVVDALARDEFDEIILSTLPSGVSRWIRQDLPHRLTRRTELPIVHVVAEAPAVAATR
jgi:hypothetical protein